jgi:hypothetical protein
VPVPRRGQRAWVLNDWFHEIRSDEAGIFVTYRKARQARDSFGRPWRKDGDQDAQIDTVRPSRAFDRAGPPTVVPVWHASCHVSNILDVQYKLLPA